MMNFVLPPLPEEEVDARLAEMDRLGRRDYKEIGVTQFIISGCPEPEEVRRFGRDVLPLVRAAEAGGSI